MILQIQLSSNKKGWGLQDFWDSEWQEGKAFFLC